MPRQLLNFSLSDYLIRIFTINSHIKWQTVQIQIEANWSGSTLFAKTDLDLHCLQRQGKAGFSRTRFMGGNQIWCFLKRVLRSKLFPFRAYFFSEGGWCVEKETNRKSQKLSPLQETRYLGGGGGGGVVGGGNGSNASSPFCNDKLVYVVGPKGQ